jgi:hypothetical protein
MSEFNKIGIPPTDSRWPAARTPKEPLAAGQAFENQLKKTVEKLKGLDREVDAMLESTQPKRLKGTLPAGETARVQDITAENITAAGKASPKSARFVAGQYEQMQSKR